MKNHAPIVLFTYNRPDTLKATIDALQKNFLARESELFIYSDAAENEDNKLKVHNVRIYLHTVKGFKSVHIIERDENFGLARSIIEGVTEILDRYEKVIVLEDDLITSKNFLCYMNESLYFYGKRKEVFSISAFTMPLKSLKDYEKDTYVSLRPSSWGWATWKDRWKYIDWDVKDFDDFIKNKEKIKSFDQGGIDLTRMLKHYKKGKNNSWAIRWAYAMFKEKKYSIYPKVSKVQNIGFGRDATHCAGMNIYKTTLDRSTGCEFDFVNEIVADEKLIEEFRYQYSYRNKFMKKIYTYIKKITLDKS